MSNKNKWQNLDSKTTSIVVLLPTICTLSCKVFIIIPTELKIYYLFNIKYVIPRSRSPLPKFLYTAYSSMYKMPRTTSDKPPTEC